MPIVVLKLGGSLLTCGDLPTRLRSLLASYASNRVLIVVGGGTAADTVRDWSQRFELSQESAHWVALRSLSLTRSLIRSLIPECIEVSSLKEANRYWRDPPTPLLIDVESHLRQYEAVNCSPFPHTWDVTSDSIAAWIASTWSAGELVLVKSAALSPGHSLSLAVESGLVDAYFPQVAAGIPWISWCNLLADPPQPKPWLCHGEVMPDL